jgi:hypothetical protein
VAISLGCKDYEKVNLRLQNGSDPIGQADFPVIFLQAGISVMNFLSAV